MKRFQISNLNVSIGKKQILRDITFDIYNDDFFVIIGSNGSGKSTLIKTLVRINNNYFGKILFNNKLICDFNLFTLKIMYIYNKIIHNQNNVKLLIQQIKFLKQHKNNKYNSKQLAKELSYVPQIANFVDNVTIYEFVKMGLFPYSNKLGYIKNTKEIENKIKSILELVGIYDIKENYISQVSGGQQQRTLIALALIQDTDTIILDEPTNHLDIKSQLEIMSLLHDLHHKLHKTIILVTHNLQIGIKYANRICILENGKIAAIGNTKDIINSQIINKIFGIKANIGYDKNHELKIFDIQLHNDNSMHELDKHH